MRTFLYCCLSVFIVLFLVLPAPAQVKQEAEPNDNRDQAQEVRVGDRVEGSVQKDNDNDWFKLAVETSGKHYLQVDLSAIPEINAYLYLLDAQGRTLFQVNEGEEGEPEFLAHFPVEPGVYFIRVYAGGKASGQKYTLTIKITGPWQEGWESEPNDNRDLANDLRWGASVSGHFHRRGDDDWYRLVNDTPGKTLVRVDLAAVPGVDGQLTIYNEKGSSLWYANEAEAGEPESIFNIALDQGTHFIRVYGRKSDPSNAYVLSTKIIGPWKEGMEAEPNNRTEDATELPLGQSVEGYFHSDGDEDYFKLVVAEPAKNVIRIELSGVPGADGRLIVYDQDRKTLWDVNDGEKGEPESVTHFAVTQGTYYIWVRGYQKNIQDKYILAARLLGPWRENQEAEPNNDIDRANELTLNSPLTGHINKEDDRDCYRLIVPAPGVDTVVIQVSGVPEVRWNLELLDPEEKRLNQSDRGQSGQGEDIVKMKFPPGTYYLRLRVRGGKNTGAEYTLYAGRPQKPPATPEEVQQALTKALDWLASTQQKDGSWERYKQAYTGLSIMAFVGAKCIQKDYSANVKAALDFLKSKHTPSSKYPEGSRDAVYRGGLFGTQEMYQHAIATLAVIEALVDLNDETLEPVAREAVQLIIRAQNTEHKPEALRGPVQADSRAYGGWRYGPDSTDSDISLTGWQILALKAAVNAGFSIPDHVFPAAAGFVRSLQGKDDGSFRYDSPGDSGASCARAGMGALSLQLSGYPKDPMVPPAIRFMQDHAPRWNDEEPGDGYPFYYWYYGTRVMFMAGGDDWRIWKDWMCRFLVDHQNPDGSWDGERSEKQLDVYRTALGALMLEFCCGHVPVYMSPVRRLGSGTVKVEFEKGAEKEASQNVEIIMDASNSMWGQIAGEAKITIAKKVLTRIINGLPDSMNVGLRVYGHRYGLNDPKACVDTELLVPIGPAAKAQLVDTVNKIQLKGKTPLVLSVLEAIKDFEKIPNGSVILVTDGIESCNGDIASIGPAIKESGLELKVHIVGFDIKEEEARAELEAIAKSTEGRYLDAKNAGELLSALEQTLRVEYVVLDEKGKEAGRGVVGGEEVKLKEGTYILRILLAPQPLETKITIKPDGRSVCVLKKETGAWKLDC